MVVSLVKFVVAFQSLIAEINYFKYIFTNLFRQNHIQKSGAMKNMHVNFQERLNEELKTLVDSNFDTSYNIIPSTGKELLPMYDTDCTPCKYLFQDTYIVRATAFCELSIYSLLFQTIGAIANPSCPIVSSDTVLSLSSNGLNLLYIY